MSAPVGPQSAPPPFRWDEWYASIGGRTIAIPEVDETIRRIYEEQIPRFSGPVAPAPVPLGTPEQAAARLKAEARRLGADAVGICELHPSDLYRGRTTPHRFAISLARGMDYAAFVDVPSRASAIECVRVYAELGEICIALAAFLRAHGFAAQVEHPLGDSDVLHIPVALRAGLGELGRHGSIIHPELGPLFRMGSVLCSLPLAVDAPIDAGIADFCDKCRACRIFCPADAIPDERDPTAGVDTLGRARFVVDTGRCFPYFARHEYCSACLPVCAFEHRKWARDATTGASLPFPRVDLQPPPPPVDPVGAEGSHAYPRLHRDGLVPIHALRRKRAARAQR